MRLGGLTWDDEPRGPVGHSDGDAAIHALIDALLGAARLGDVGAHFPPGEAAWEGADSAELLARAVSAWPRTAGDRPASDLVVAAARPPIAPRRDELVGPDRRPARRSRPTPSRSRGRPRTASASAGEEGIAAWAVAAVERTRVTEWIGGRRPVAEALAAGREAHRLIISATAKPAPELRAITDAARRAHLPVDRVPADQMTRIGGFDGHQGVLLEVGERRWTERRRDARASARDGREPFVLVLEHLQDPTNFGTLLRSAEAAGVDGVVFPERGAAPLSAAAVKASAGASEHLLHRPAADDRRGDPRAQVRGLRLVAADQDAPASAWQSDLTGPLAIVVGSEGSGLSGATRAAATSSSASRWPDRWQASTPRRRARSCCSRSCASGAVAVAAAAGWLTGAVGVPATGGDRCRSTCRASATRPRRGHGS